MRWDVLYLASALAVASNAGRYVASGGPFYLGVAIFFACVGLFCLVKVARGEERA